MRRRTCRLFALCSSVSLLAWLLHPSFGCTGRTRGDSETKEPASTAVAGAPREWRADKQAVDGVGIPGPVTGVGGLGGSSRTVQSPKFPGWWIVLRLDGDRRLIDWAWHADPVSGPLCARWPECGTAAAAAGEAAAAAASPA